VKPHNESAAYEHRSCIVVDVENSSSRPDPDLMALRTALYEIVDDALARSPITPGQWVREDRGDGIMLLFASAVQKIDIVDPLLDHLVTALLRHNHGTALDKWMRLRVALHAGEVQRDQAGWGGAALTLTFRLSAARPVKEALARAPRAQCVIVASHEFYDSVIRHGHRSIDPANYRPIWIPLGNDSVRAWVRIPGYEVPPGMPGPAEPSKAALAAALLAAHLSAEKLGDGAGRGSWPGQTDFLALVRDRFRNDSAAQVALATAQRNPRDPEAVALLGAALRRHASEDEHFAAELEQADRKSVV